MALSLIFIGCSKDSKDSKETSGNTAKELDGTWEKGNYSFDIKGSDYVMKIDAVNWGKGIITYNIADGIFNVKSTHAWSQGSWVSYQETSNGTFNYNDNEMTILSVDNNLYAAVVGKWTRK